MKSLIALLCLAYVLVNFSAACPAKFKNSTDSMKQAMECVSTLHLTDLDKALEKVKDPEADDKCFSRCLLEKMEMIDDEGGLDRDALFDYLEEQAPKALLAKLTEIANKCADSELAKVVKEKPKETPPAPKPKPKDPVKPALVLANCPAYHSFYQCFVSNAEKLC